jgi:xylulokinase
VPNGITVGLDIGTTSVKGLAVDGDGTILARSRVPHELIAPSAAVFEHDAKQAWVDGPRAALDLLGVPDYDAIAIASMLPSLTAVDAEGIPISPGLLYGDHRGRIGEVVADPLNSGEFRAMLEWTLANAPDAHGYWTAPAVAGVAIGGAPAIDYGTAFALSPLWSGDWVSGELAGLGLRVDQMPLVFGDDEVAGHVGSAVQGCGVADAWSEATVSGASNPGDTLVICGTTLIVWCIVAEKVRVPGMWEFRHPLADARIVAGASNAGALFVNWVRRNLAEPSGGSAAPGAVPIWVPYLRGERNPLHDATLRASLHGLDLGHGPAEIRRAAYEATAFVTRRYMDTCGPGTTRIVASGGGTHDTEWMQALADCTGRPVDLVAVPEGAALGAAWHARVVAGLDKAEDASRWARVGGRIEPDPLWVAPCEDRYHRWLDLAGE